MTTECTARVLIVLLVGWLGGSAAGLGGAAAWADPPGAKERFAALDGLKKVAADYQHADVRAEAEKLLSDLKAKSVPEFVRKALEARLWADEAAAVSDALTFVTLSAFNNVPRILDREERKGNPAALVCPDLVKLMTLFAHVGEPAIGQLERCRKLSKEREEAEYAVLEQIAGVASDAQYRAQQLKANVAQSQRHFAELALAFVRREQK